MDSTNTGLKIAALRRMVGSEVVEKLLRGRCRAFRVKANRIAAPKVA